MIYSVSCDASVRHRGVLAWAVLRNALLVGCDASTCLCWLMGCDASTCLCWLIGCGWRLQPVTSLRHRGVLTWAVLRNAMGAVVGGPPQRRIVPPCVAAAYVPATAVARAKIAADTHNDRQAGVRPTVELGLPPNRSPINEVLISPLPPSSKT